MTDDRSHPRVEPAPAFADRLERELLARLAAPTSERSRVMIDLATQRSSVRTWNRPRMLVAASVAAIAVAAGVVALQLDRDSDAPPVAAPAAQHAIAFEIEWPDLRSVEGVNCVESETTYFSATDGRCFREFVGEVPMTGDVDGTGLWAMLGNLGEAANADDTSVNVPSAFTATYIVKATVAGCGQGEFMVSEQLRFDGWESGAFSGTWEIVPGSGRQDLSDISGGGLVPGDFPARNTSQATRTGQVSCD